MWRPYGTALCVDAETPVILYSGTTKIEVQLLLIWARPRNTGNVYLVSSIAKQPQVNRLDVSNLLGWLPPPSPTGLPPLIKLAISAQPGSYYVLSDVPGEGVAISGYVY